MLLAAVFTTVEGEVISRATGADFRGGSSTFGGTLYSVSLISCFLAFDQAVLPNWKLIDLVSRRLLGIYLIHPVMLIIAAKLAYHFIPQILAYQTVFQPFLIITAVGGSLSIMEIASRWPTWRYYKFVFG
jgi:surface polysaccharide O-acyltransferase-like enzyme